MKTEIATNMMDARLLLLLQMDDAIHALSQPLTTVAFAVELAACSDDAIERHAMLGSAQVECARAIEHVANLRAHMAQLMGVKTCSKKEMA